MKPSPVSLARSGARRMRRVRGALAQQDLTTERAAEHQRVALDATTAQVATLATMLEAHVAALGATLDALRDDQRQLAAELAATRGDLTAFAQLTLDDESATRRALVAARSSPEYERPFSERDPLVSICIPTCMNHRQLLERAIPSAFGQEHRNVEIVVVGDDAPQETASALERLDDPRVRYENLAVRGPYPDDSHRRWLVAGTGPLNRAFELARGEWIAILNDDDALRPHHISTLLAAAQESRGEVVYGRLEQFAPDGTTEILGSFPPRSHQFGWQLALQHRAMALFEFKLAAELFGEPGDWHRARRMLRAGVRFRRIDEIVCDYYPSRLWNAE